MLKEREQKILDYMKTEIKTKGYPPTVREICNALGIKSTSTVHKDIESLVRQGYLKKDPSKPRALMVVEPSDESGHTQAAHGYSSDIPDSASSVNDVVEIPIVGRVAAGTPILAEENIEDPEDIKHFNRLGYIYRDDFSSNKEFVFERKG